MLIPHFCGGSYQALSPIVNNEETINLIVERLQPVAAGAKAAAAMWLRPGVRSWADPSLAGHTRASIVAAGRLFAIISNKVVEFDLNGTATVHGTVAIDENPATISSNGPGGQLFITSGGKGYILVLATNALTEEVTSGCTMGAFIDTFFIYLDAAASALYKSASYDGTTWDPTEVTERGLAGDPWVAMTVSTANRQIILNGQWTTDVYYNNGDSPFPFRPRPDGLIPEGSAAPFSVRDLNGVTVWVGQTKDGCGWVVALSGLEAQRISHPPLDTALERLGDAIDRLESDSFEYRGHQFYLITVDSVTHVFDKSSGVWTKWLTWNSAERRYVGWRPTHHAFAFGKHLMGDRSSSRWLELSQDLYADAFASDEERPIRWLRRCPLPWASNRRVFIASVELLHEAGLGVSGTGQGADPVAAMRLSFDAGKTWSSERTRALGKIGEFDVQAIWERCGSGRQPVIEFTGTDPAPVRILGLEVDMHDGTRSA